MKYISKNNICTRKVLFEKHNPCFEVKIRKSDGSIEKVRRSSDETYYKTFFWVSLLSSINENYQIVKFNENLVDIHIRKCINDEEIICKINQISILNEQKIKSPSKKSKRAMFKPAPLVFEPQRKRDYLEVDYNYCC
nr:hypothetical protein [uncultured archaeon]